MTIWAVARVDMDIPGTASGAGRIGVGHAQGGSAQAIR